MKLSFNSCKLVKVKFLLGYCIILFCINISYVGAQINLETKKYLCPSELVFHEYPFIQKNPAIYITYSSFFPVGWSQDSKLAYIRRGAREAADGDVYAIYIQDMVTDSVVFKELIRTRKHKNIKEFWLENRDSLESIFNKYKIQQTSLKLFHFPLTTSQIHGSVVNIIETNLAIKREKPPFYNYMGIKSLQIELILNGTRIKQIHSKTFKYLPYAVSVVGFFKSPFEERIAVVVCILQRGFEGVPSKYFSLIGAGIGQQF